MTKVPHPPQVALKLPVALGLLLDFVRAVVLAMTGNPRFPSPSPSLATVTAAASDLGTAQAAVEARTKGAVVTRDAKRAALVAVLKALAGYVQGVANADPANAAAIIQSAAMHVARSRTHGPRPFGVKAGPVPGSVVAEGPSAGRHGVSYDWQSSTDGGKTWQNAPSTARAKALLPGFDVGSTVSFRFRANTAAGAGPWSLPVTVVVR